MKRRVVGRDRKDLLVGTWNVCTLAESFGGLRVCRKQKLTGDRDNSSEVVNRKLDLFVGELQRRGVSVAGVQETRWFGEDVWPAIGGFTFLHSGRPLPVVWRRQ